jgi:hypothetical protein
VTDLTHSEQIQLANLTMALLDEWGVRDADKISLLALPRDVRPRALRRYQQNTPFPDDARIYERIEHLLGIAEALRNAYPRNVHGAALWLNRGNRRFKGRTPLAAMIEDGLTGITAVRIHVDCSYDWFLDEQRTRQER